MIRKFFTSRVAKAFGGNAKQNFGAHDESAVVDSTCASHRRRSGRVAKRMLGAGRSRWWLLAIAFLLPLCLYAATAPKLTRHVTDLTGTLSAAQVNDLDARLGEFEQAKGTQLVVLMVNSTGQEGIEAYSMAVAEANQIGRKGTDDGILLLIAKSDRHVRIEVGYGLEGVIPDVVAAHIIAVEVTPRFRSDDYFGGISHAVDALVERINAESLPPTESAISQGSPVVAIVLILLVIILVLLFGLFVRRVYVKQRAKRGATTLSAVLWTIFWVAAGILILFLGLLFLIFKLRGRRGGTFTGGNGMFKGGGGRFGGGGASGNW